MPIGPGKYDALATYALRASLADAVIVIVDNGINGSGFALQAINHVNGHALADVLEKIAKDIRDDWERAKVEAERANS